MPILTDKKPNKSKLVGQAVREYRWSLDLTQAQFAQMNDVCIDTVLKWEHGACRPPFKIIEKLLKRVPANH